MQFVSNEELGSLLSDPYLELQSWSQYFGTVQFFSTEVVGYGVTWGNLKKNKKNILIWCSKVK